MKREDAQMREVHPSFQEELAPVADDAFDRRTRIKLGAESVEDEADVSRKVSECGLIYLEESVAALPNGHVLRDGGV